MYRSLVLLLWMIFGITSLNAASPIDDGVPTNRIGIVIMHGKGGMPTRYVTDLATHLTEKAYLVDNLEMPWSGRRDYDVNVTTAEFELQSAIDGLRARGAEKLFVAGHSQGGLFALYFAGRHPANLDGVIALAPGGYVNGPLTREKLADDVAQARRLIAEGKGAETTRLLDFEGSRGTYPIIVKPVIYLDWFDPAGAMTLATGIKQMSPLVPVLFVAPTRDHPGLLKAKQSIFDALPPNPHSKLYEPSADHLGAPSASREEIERWTREIAGGRR